MRGQEAIRRGTKCGRILEGKGGGRERAAGEGCWMLIG